jgi:adenosylcobinamide kinase/adenosylcobinamide-phosphate guanylyltransferase
MRQGSRWNAGAAPATVSGEILVTSHWRLQAAGKAPVIDDPEPGDLRLAALQPIVLGGRGVLPHRAESLLPAASRLNLPPLSLVLGGARSGKSRHAEDLIDGAAGSALYLATAEPRDAEMRARIAAHRARRGPHWATIEEPLALAAVLAAEARPNRPILVDCLTLWLSNLVLAERDIAAESERLLATLAQLAGPVVLVANEIGLGIVPDNALARLFRDHAGHLNQQVATLADRVVFMAAGLPLVLKGKS